jgi:hypothetical protein
MTLLRAMPGSCEDIHTVSLLDPAALWHPCRRQNVSPLRNSVKGAGPLVDARSISRRNKGHYYSGSVSYIDTGDPTIWENSILAIRKPDVPQTLKKEHRRLATSACCSSIFGLLTHNVSSGPTRLWEPQHLVRPFETLGTATSRQTLRDFRNRNISSDPSKLWEPQHLVGPYETLGTATSRQTLRDSGNRNISSDPSKLREPQGLVRPFETLRTVHRTDRRGAFSVMF